MDRPNDLPQPVWDRAIAVADQLDGDEGTTHHEYWRRVELLARALWAERQDSADIARGFYGGNAIAKAIMLEGAWAAHGWAPAKSPPAEGMLNAWRPEYMDSGPRDWDDALKAEEESAAHDPNRNKDPA